MLHIRIYCLSAEPYWSTGCVQTNQEGSHLFSRLGGREDETGGVVGQESGRALEGRALAS